MATGPGPGSHAIGGAHVDLAVGLTSYYRDLQKALQALQAWTTKANQILKAVSFSPASLDVDDLRRSLQDLNRTLLSAGTNAKHLSDHFRAIKSAISAMNSMAASALKGFGSFSFSPASLDIDDLRRSLQGLNRTLMSAGVNAKYLADQFSAMKASAAAVQAVASGTARSQTSNQAALIRANAYAQAQAALAAQRTAAAGAQAALAARRGGTAPAAPGGIPLTPGDVFAGQFQDWFRGVTAAVRVANRKFLDWGTSVTGGFQHFARMIDAFGGSRFFSGMFQGLAQATASVTDHGTRMGTQIAATVRQIGNFAGGQSRFFNAVASGFRGMGTAFSTVGSTFTSAVQTVGSVGMGVVRGALSAFGTVLRAGWNVLAGTIRGIASTIVGGLRTAIGSIGKLGVLAGGVGAAFSLVYITDQIVTMEHNLVRLQRTAGGTRAEIAQMASSFFDMGRTLAGVELDKVIELSIMGSRLGVPRQQLDLFTRDLAKVSAVLEDIPIEEASQRFSGMIDVFQLAYPDTIKLASALNALDIASNASARDILDIAGRMSGAASTIGLTAQQTLALATAMRQARVPIETAGTAMSQILGRMTGAELPAFARVAGLSVGKFRDLMQRDALQALVAVEQGLGRMDAFGRFRALDELHLDGQRVRLVMLQLVPVLGRLNQYLNIANEEWDTTNSIMQGFVLQSETAQAQFQRMWNNVQLLAVSLGTLLLPVIKGVANGIGNLASDVREFVLGSGERLRTWGEAVGNSLETLGATFRVFRNNFRDIWQIVGAQTADLWGQLKRNAFDAFAAVVKIGANAMDQLAQYIVQALSTAISNAFTRAFAAAAANLPAGLVQFLTGVDPAKFQQQARNLPPIPQAGNFLNPDNLLRGVVPPAGIQAPGMLGMIGGLFGNAVAAQRQERAKREADATFEDWLTRMFAPKGKAAAAGRGGGPLAAMAAMMDQNEGAAGGGGLGGVGGAGGGINPIAMAMAGMARGRPAPVQAQGPRNLIDVANVGLESILGPALAGFGMPGISTPGIPVAAAGAGPRRVQDALARARHNALIGWRQRMAARRGQGHQMGPGIVNPWIAIRNQLAARRNAAWEFLAASRGKLPPARSRLELMRKVAVEQHRQQQLRRQREALGQAGAPSWAATGISQIVAELQGIKRAVGIPVFGD